MVRHPIKVWIAVAVMLFWCAAAACRSDVSPGRPPQAEPTRRVTDDLGRAVDVPARLERVVSLAPSLTEMIFAAGAGDRLVGVTTYCNYPAEARSIQKVSDTQTPNIESIIAIKPQVVFVSTASQLEAFADTLEVQGIKVYVTDAQDLSGIIRNLRQLGEMFGTSARAEAVAADLEQRTAELANRLRDVRPIRVFVQISNEPLFTIGRDSFLTEVIARSGGVSVTADVATAYPKLSKETALALDPEAIVLSDSSDNKEPNAVFRNSKAVRNGRVIRVDADIISRPGPRIVDAMEFISTELLRGER